MTMEKAFVVGLESTGRAALASELWRFHRVGENGSPTGAADANRVRLLLVGVRVGRLRRRRSSALPVLRKQTGSDDAPSVQGARAASRTREHEPLRFGESSAGE